MSDKKKTPEELGLQRNKYLDALGIPIEQYGVNFCDNTDERYKDWEAQRKELGFDSRDCWNYDCIFFEQLYSHFKLYLEEAGKVIDLNYYKFDYKGKQITQKKAIKIIIKACEDYLKKDFLDRYENMPDADIFKLLHDILPHMWW